MPYPFHIYITYWVSHTKYKTNLLESNAITEFMTEVMSKTLNIAFIIIPARSENRNKHLSMI